LAAAFQVHLASRPREVGRQGGLLALVHNTVAAYVRVVEVDAANSVMWLTLTPPGSPRPTLHIAACYIPPANSSIHQRPTVEDPWQALHRHISRQAGPGEPVLLMGDFNARTGGLPESPDLEELKYALPNMLELVDLLQQDLPPRRSVDPTHNAFGKELLALLASRAMCIFNGRVPGRNNHSWTSLNHRWPGEGPEPAPPAPRCPPTNAIAPTSGWCSPAPPPQLLEHTRGTAVVDYVAGSIDLLP
jgi:hypothetical protein